MSYSLRILMIVIFISTHLIIHAGEEKKSELKRAISPVSVSRSTIPTALTVSMDPTATAAFKDMRDSDKKKFKKLYKGLKRDDLLIKTNFVGRIRRQSKQSQEPIVFPAYMPAYLFRNLREKNGDSVTFTLDGQSISARLTQCSLKINNVATPTFDSPIEAQRPLGKELDSPKLFEKVFTESTNKAYAAQIEAGDPCCSDCVIM